MVPLIDPGPIEFDAEVQGEGSGMWVDVPFDLKSTYGKGNLVPVVATFDGRVRYQGSLAKMGGPQGMVLIRNDVRDALGVAAGDIVHVRLELVSAPREVALPDDVTALVAAHANAAATWTALSPSNKREYARWIEEAKRPETRQRRVTETVRKLAAGEKLR